MGPGLDHLEPVLEGATERLWRLELERVSRFGPPGHGAGWGLDGSGS